MKIESGHSYLTRSGDVVGPVEWDDVIQVWRRTPNFERNTGDYWHVDGSRYGHVEDDLDLVSKAPDTHKEER